MELEKVSQGRRLAGWQPGPVSFPRAILKMSLHKSCLSSFVKIAVNGAKNEERSWSLPAQQDSQRSDQIHEEEKGTWSPWTPPKGRCWAGQLPTRHVSRCDPQ